MEEEYQLDELDVQDLTDIGEFVEDEPETVRIILQSYGMQPSADIGQQALQLIAASIESEDFDAELARSYQGSGDTLDFKLKLGGLGKVFGKIGGIFKKKEGGSKVGNFFKNLFKGKKKVLAEAQAKVAAGLPLTKREIRVMGKHGRPVMGPPPPPRLAAPTTSAALMAEDNGTDLAGKIKKLEEEIKKKDQQIMYGGIGFAIIIIVMGIALWRANQ